MSTRIYREKSYTIERGASVEWADGWKAAVWPIVADHPAKAKEIALREIRNGRVGWIDAILVSVDLAPQQDEDEDGFRYYATVRYRTTP